MPSPEQSMGQGPKVWPQNYSATLWEWQTEHQFPASLGEPALSWEALTMTEVLHLQKAQQPGLDSGCDPSHLPGWCQGAKQVQKRLPTFSAAARPQAKPAILYWPTSIQLPHKYLPSQSDTQQTPQPSGENSLRSSCNREHLSSADMVRDSLIQCCYCCWYARSLYHYKK